MFLCSVKMKDFMLKKRTLSLLLSLFAFAAASAQTGTIHGTVIDAETGAALVGTTVTIEGTNVGTSTDALGSFNIYNISPGRVTITASYLGYEVFRSEVAVGDGQVSTITIPLQTESVNLERVMVVARIDNESEGAQLAGQKKQLTAYQSVGAAEMSRKGLGDAESAVAQVSGISRQEGVKNVFVRGLGDRYNATFFNGFLLPSEDPEYKNIALQFFGSDIIRDIGVSKVFGAANNGDVGGAVIDIRSKQLLNDTQLELSVGAGVNSAAFNGNFARQDGVSYFGNSNKRRPDINTFSYQNKLNPSKVSLPLDHSYAVSGGHRWLLGMRDNPLSVFAVASHSSSFSQTDETVRNSNTGDMVYQEMTGQRSNIGIDQLMLANVNYNLRKRHLFEYNFLLIHANDQYVGEYSGKNSEDYQDAHDGVSGWRLRQQSNDNLLMTHQLSTHIELAKRWRVRLGAAVNTIKGSEPDRRENNMSLQADGQYTATGSDSQRRFFSELNETDLNMKAAVSYRLTEGRDFDASNITLGYRGRMVDDGFESGNYSYGAFRSGAGTLPAGTPLDDLYNSANVWRGNVGGTPVGEFHAGSVSNDSYSVAKNIHSISLEATHKLGERLSGSVGVQADRVTMDVEHNNKGRNIDTLYWLPSLNLRYDLSQKHTLRLGASKSYTLPQSKEISDYQYVDISFASQGNMNLRASDNYNLDLKWDFYPSYSELLSIGLFYKHIKNPIGRVDQGNSAGLLSYDNIARHASVAGVEFELRKNLFNTTTIRQNMRRLSMGLNVSCIHSSMQLDVVNTPQRRSELEGASPWLVNADLSYNYSTEKRVLNLSLVAGWSSNRIHTLGTQGYNDIIEESAMTLSLVSSLRLSDRWIVKMHAANLLNPHYRLTRKLSQSDGEIVLDEYRKGMNLSVGVTFDL